MARGSGSADLATEGGEILVLQAGRQYRLLGSNAIGESLMATPAIADGTLYVRMRSHLYAIGNDGGASEPNRARSQTLR